MPCKNNSSEQILTKTNTFPTAVLPNGHLGVDVFFVLSGLLTICNLLASQTSPTRLRKFAIRRVMRIAPPFYVTYGIYCIIASFVSAAAKCEGYKIASSALFFQNEYPLGKQCMAWGWTVAVEVQFYLVAAAVALPGKSKQATILLLALTAAGIAARYVVVYQSTPALDASNMDSTAHDSNGRYFDRMYASSETR